MKAKPGIKRNSVAKVVHTTNNVPHSRYDPRTSFRDRRSFGAPTAVRYGNSKLSRFAVLQTLPNEFNNLLNAIAFMFQKRQPDESHIATRQTREQAYRPFGPVSHQIH
jgi:hypothetical protein